MSQISELIAFAQANGNLTKMFSLLKPLTRAYLMPYEIAILANYFKKKDVGLQSGVKLINQDPSIYGRHLQYRCYRDWFIRDLTESTLAELKAKATSNKFSIPVECVIESIGTVGDPSSIIRLKRPAQFVNQDLLTEGIPHSHAFVNMKLLTSHYHHVRSPCAGVVKKIKLIPASESMFGKASVTFVVIGSKHGDVGLMIIGEAVVQDFESKITVGRELNALDDLGNFAWGSQVVMLIPADLAEIEAKKRRYYFVGDKVA
jgi:hypothetical protein